MWITKLGKILRWIIILGIIGYITLSLIHTIKDDGVNGPYPAIIKG